MIASHPDLLPEPAKRIHGVGLGLRRALLREQLQAIEQPDCPIDFFELAPENWLNVGGRFGAALAQIANRCPLIAHGLSLSLGGTDPLDLKHLQAIKAFLARYDIEIYSEHLSATAIDGHLYDLAPLPFASDMVAHISTRILQTQDLLGRRIAVENSSYYLLLSEQMSELEFIQAILERADCELLLDVNNVYVNSQNHGYDAKDFIDALPAQRVRYLHIAGHDPSSTPLVDTHGAAVPEQVWDLLRYTYDRIGLRPTLIERDFNMPPFAELLDELQRARQLHHA